MLGACQHKPATFLALVSVGAGLARLLPSEMNQWGSTDVPLVSMQFLCLVNTSEISVVVQIWLSASIHR